MAKPTRPAFVRNVKGLKRQKPSSYPGSKETFSHGARLSNAFHLKRLGIWHDVLGPGKRTSWPHAHLREEEFVYVLKGNPSLWANGRLVPLRPGDAVGFPAGTGIAHSILNNSRKPVEMLVVGEARVRGERLFYPMHPSHNRLIRGKGLYWAFRGYRRLGLHDGMPDLLRKSGVR